MEVIQQEVGLEGKELCKNICKWIKMRVHQPMPADWEVWEIFLDHEIQMAQNVGWEDRNAKNSLLAVTRGWLSQSVFLAVKCRRSQVCIWIPSPFLSPTSIPSLPLASPFCSPFSSLLSPARSPPLFPSFLPFLLFNFLFPPSSLVCPFLFLSHPTPPLFFSFHTTLQLLYLRYT